MLHVICEEGKTIRNNQDDRRAERDMNNEPPNNRYNGFFSASTIVFNVIYPRDFFTVSSLTVNSYAVFITRTTSALFSSVIN